MKSNPLTTLPVKNPALVREESGADRDDGPCNGDESGRALATGPAAKALAHGPIDIHANPAAAGRIRILD